MQQDYDLLIVGGGLAGNCLALALQQTDLRIAIVEATSREQRRTSPAGDRALALAGGSVRLLEMLNVWQQAKRSATAIKQIHISDQGHFGKTRLSSEQEGVAALGYVISARDLEENVADLVDQADITQLCPARVTGLMSGDDQVYVSIKHHNKAINLSAKLLIGADGGNSSVRKLLEIKQRVSEYGQTAIVSTIQSSVAHNHTAYERFTPSGPLALLPHGDNFSLVWTRSHEAAEELMSCCETEFIQQLHNCFGYKLGEFSLQAARRAFPLTLIKAEKILSGRVVLVGNAVHQLHPVAGQGFNLGLRDVVQLADMLISQQHQGADIGEQNFLHAYARQRKQDHDKVITFTNGLVRIFSNQWLPLAVARNTGLALLDLMPSVKTVFAKHAMGMNTRMPQFNDRRS
jgi:2-octaprenyl-6-methoxyphenol hydroxylase